MTNYERRPQPYDDGRYDCICGHTQMYHESWLFFWAWVFRHRVLSKCDICMCPRFKSQATYMDNGQKKRIAN